VAGQHPVASKALRRREGDEVAATGTHVEQVRRLRSDQVAQTTQRRQVPFSQFAAALPAR
jgi:hypothetical protein